MTNQTIKLKNVLSFFFQTTPEIRTVQDEE